MDIPIAFAECIVNKSFDQAYNMLSNSEKIKWSADSMKEGYTEMLSFCSGKVVKVEKVDVPDAEPGWFYIAITGDDFNEAVSGVVQSDGSISDVSFGRP